MTTHWSNKFQNKCNDNGFQNGQRLGWGGCLENQSDELKNKFINEFKSNEEVFYGYWPQGFSFNKKQ